MTPEQTQLLELEQTIRQRRLYQEAQEKQIQRNLVLLDRQATQRTANRAALTRQAHQLTALETDTAAVLDRLRRKAEQTPSARYRELTARAEQAERAVALLTERTNRLEAARADSQARLASLDADVLAADGVLRARQTDIMSATHRKLELERQGSDRADALAVLSADLRVADTKLARAHKFKLRLEHDQDRLGATLASRQRQLTDIRAALAAKTAELATLNATVDDTRRSLAGLQTEDRDFRANLAQEKLKLAEASANLTVRKQALRRELEVKQAVDPTFKLRVSDEPRHFTL